MLDKEFCILHFFMFSGRENLLCNRDVESGAKVQLYSNETSQPLIGGDIAPIVFVTTKT